MTGQHRPWATVFRPHARTGLLTAVALALIAGWLVASPAGAAGPGETAEKVVAPAAGTPEFQVQQALQAALDPDEAKGFQRYLELLHPTVKDTPDAIEQLRRYSWKRFRTQASDYIVPGTKGGFTLTRRDPPKVTAATTHVRLFLSAVNNSSRTFPTPIRLERAGDRWLITANSL